MELIVTADFCTNRTSAIFEIVC